MSLKKFFFLSEPLKNILSTAILPFWLRLRHSSSPYLHLIRLRRRSSSRSKWVKFRQRNYVFQRFLSFIIIPFIFLFSGCVDNSEANLATELKDKPSKGSVTIDKNNIDLGDIPIQGGKVNVEFTFKNTGSEPVALLEGATSCMCTEAVVKSADGMISPTIVMPMSGPGHGGHGGAGPTKVYQVLNPDESATVIATFDPLAHGPDAVGPITREVVIYTNSTETSEVKFKFSGNVVR